VATLVVVTGLFGVFAFRPTPFIGLTPEAVANSLDSQLGGEPPSCEEVADKQWDCTTGTQQLDLEINAFGCWAAEPKANRPAVGTPSTLSGCVTLWDH
jgi:hypothetical protein